MKRKKTKWGMSQLSQKEAEDEGMAEEREERCNIKDINS